MAGGLGFLAGLGQAAQGLPQGLGKAQEIAQSQAQLDEIKRAHLAHEDYQRNAGMTDVGQLFQVMGLPQANLASLGPGPLKLPPTTASMLVTKTLADQEQQKSLTRGGMMADASDRMYGTTDPYIASAAQAYRIGGYDPTKHAALEEKRQEYIANQARMRSMGPLFEKLGLPNPYSGGPQGAAPPVQAEQPLGPPKIMPTSSSPPPGLSDIAQQAEAKAGGYADQPDPGFRAAAADVGRMGQRVAQLPGAQTAAIPSAPVGGAATAGPPSGMEGMQQDFSIQLGNGMTVHVKPTPKATVGDQYIEAVKAVQALEDANVPPTDPRYARAAKHMDRLKFSALGPGGSLAGPSGLGPLAKGETPPVTQPVAQDIRGLANVRDAAESVKQALKDPTVLGYIGPAAQYKSTVQMKTPMGIAGQVPPAVVDMEQNLKRIQNYTIKLITGAQMSEQEARRIMSELPDQGTPPDVFARRLDNSMAQIQRMEQLTINLALRGDQQAIRTATELGLMKPGQQGAAPASAGTPGVVKWTRDAQGNPVRLP